MFDELFLPWLICTGIFIAIIGFLMMFAKVKPPYEDMGISQAKWEAFEKGQFEDHELLQLLPQHKIYAIKFWRRKTGLGLKEAMEEVNEMEKKKLG
ncbi:hypothetical protein IT411_01665 [Candidatus Peregrinibacteria bacterium]|nr:hypothetical protein [Candidatus Peregrinibacteria bacterium]